MQGVPKNSADLRNANPGGPVNQINFANDDLEIGDIQVLLGQHVEAA